jgi:NAD(P)-dependent dehydrogenase (short-subunit alcohol dehydrogenase family)
VTDTATLTRAVETAGATLAGWVNNAAVQTNGRFDQIGDEAVARTLDVNLRAPLLGCREAVRAFLARGVAGAIVNVSSIHGRAGAVAHAAYDTSKGAIDALTRHVATAYGPYGIRANAIAPGAIMTLALEQSFEAAEDGAARRALLEEKAPLRRIGEPAEIAAVAAFLLSDEASFLTGQSIAVDGGWTTALVPPALDPELAERYGLR